MARTNIDLDDELVAEAMRRYNLATKREVVDLALRRLIGRRLTKQDIDAVRGIGWEGCLDELRQTRSPRGGFALHRHDDGAGFGQASR